MPEIVPVRAVEHENAVLAGVPRARHRVVGAAPHRIGVFRFEVRFHRAAHRRTHAQPSERRPAGRRQGYLERMRLVDRPVQLVDIQPGHLREHQQAFHAGRRLAVEPVEIHRPDRLHDVRRRRPAAVRLDVPRGPV